MDPRRERSAASLQVVLVMAALLSSLGPSAAVRYSRCGLVGALRQHGFPEDLLRNWVCLVEAESGRDTGVISGPNSDGSHDYGLFQINDRYWCGHVSAGGDCHVRCKDLAQDDIAEAAACAVLIYSRRGFWAWYGWIRSCHGHHLPDISMCSLRDEHQQYSVVQV